MFITLTAYQLLNCIKIDEHSMYIPQKKNRFFYIKYVDQFSQILDNLIVQRFQSKKLENLRQCDKEGKKKGQVCG
jgi:hypothetical protein